MRFRVITTALLAGAFALPSASLGDTFRVRATNDDTWMPAVRRIHKGDRIVWRNPSDSQHTVTAYSPNWDKNTFLEEGQSTAKRFRRRGVFKYYCELHGHVANDGTCHGMCGKIRVLRPL